MIKITLFITTALLAICGIASASDCPVVLTSVEGCSKDSQTDIGIELEQAEQQSIAIADVKTIPTLYGEDSVEKKEEHADSSMAEERKTKSRSEVSADNPKAFLPDGTPVYHVKTTELYLDDILINLRKLQSRRSIDVDVPIKIKNEIVRCNDALMSALSEKVDEIFGEIELPPCKVVVDETTIEILRDTIRVELKKVFFHGKSYQKCELGQRMRKKKMQRRHATFDKLFQMYVDEFFRPSTITR